MTKESLAYGSNVHVGFSNFLDNHDLEKLAQQFLETSHPVELDVQSRESIRLAAKKVLKYYTRGI